MLTEETEIKPQIAVVLLEVLSEIVTEKTEKDSLVSLVAEADLLEV
jgi:hypothetical protein